MSGKLGLHLKRGHAVPTDLLYSAQIMVSNDRLLEANSVYAAMARG